MAKFKKLRFSDGRRPTLAIDCPHCHGACPSCNRYNEDPPNGLKDCPGCAYECCGFCAARHDFRMKVPLDPKVIGTEVNMICSFQGKGGGQGELQIGIDRFPTALAEIFIKELRYFLEVLGQTYGGIGKVTEQDLSEFMRSKGVGHA